ncbi:unnamed protein product, partial [Iphiclides podalirius]
MYSLGVVLLVCAYFSVARALPPCVCTRERRPVCGSDGRTYNNRCLLDCARSTDPSIRMVSGGSCETRAPANCICTFEFNPVCGTDGETYPNQCSLSCRQAQQPGLAVRNKGPCGTGRQMDSCVCTRLLRPVCGTDGVTYPNPCMLNCARESNPDLQVLRAEPCDELKSETPKKQLCACARNLEPVCASNGVTYSNRCMMKCAGNQLTIKSFGSCDES